MVLEAYLDSERRVYTDGAAARELLTILDQQNHLRAPLEQYMFGVTDTLDGALRETDVLHSVGLAAHPVGLEERIVLANGQKRVLIIGATQESISSARELLQQGVAVVLVDTFPSTVNRALPLAEELKKMYTPDVFHHPLMFTVKSEQVAAYTSAARTFDGVLINRNAESLHDITQKTKDVPQVFASASLFASGKQLEIDADGLVTLDGVKAGAIGLAHNRSLGRIFVAGEDPYVVVQAARAAVELRVAHARLRSAELSKSPQESNRISRFAMEPVVTHGWTDVRVGDSTKPVVDTVLDEHLPSSVKDGVTIIHPEGITAFERIGFTRDMLRRDGITVVDHSSVTDVTDLKEGMMVSRDWWVTKSLNVKQTDKVGALIIASTVTFPADEFSDVSPVVLEMGERRSAQTDQDVASLMTSVVTRHISFNAYEHTLRSAMNREHIRSGSFEPRILIEKRQEHLVQSSYETLAHLFRSYGHTEMAKSNAKSPFLEYMIAVGDALQSQARFADVNPNAVGIRDIEILVPRYDAPEKRRKRVKLGVRVLHDGSIQIENEPGKWSPIENMMTVSREVGKDEAGNPILEHTQVVDHRRFHINHTESAEARLINHILKRLQVDRQVYDPNTKFASVMGLRGARHANLIDLIGSMYPVDSHSPKGTKGSAYQTPQGGVRITWNPVASNYEQSIWINAQGVVYKIGNTDVHVEGDRTSINPISKAEEYLSFMLLPERIDDVGDMHDRAMRELFLTSIRMAFSPLVMDLLRQQGLDHTAPFDFSKRFIMHRYRSGITDHFGETRLYYAVEYQHDDGTVSDLGLRVFDTGAIQLHDTVTGEWKKTASDAHLLNHMCERIGVTLSENQYTGFPIQEFFTNAIMDIDRALQHRAITTYARSAGVDQITAARLANNAPIVFGQAGEVYVLMRDGENEEVFERILSDRRMKKLLRRMAAQESLHIDTDRYAAEKKLKAFEQEHGVKISMALSAIGSFLAVFNGANPGDVVIGSLGAGGLGLLSMYTAVHMQEKFHSKHAVTAARIAYRMGEYLLLSGAEAALGGITGYAATRVFPPDHQVQTFGQAVSGVLPDVFRSASVQDPLILQPSIDAATALQATSQVPLDTVTALVDSPVGSLTWDLHAAVNSILSGTGWVNEANNVTQAQVIQHYLMQCAGDAIRNTPDMPISQLLSDGEIENVRQIIATSSYREYLQAVMNGLYH